MRYKKIMILTIILTCILAISAVSAAENENDDIISADVSDVVGVEETTDEFVSVDVNNQVAEQYENDEIISAKDDGTFTALQNKINNAAPGSTITLENDYKSDGSDYVQITKNLTINGNGHKLDGLFRSAIFDVNGNDKNITVTMNNIKFFNGYDSDHAAVRLTQGNTLILQGCLFENNVGALASGGNLIVQKCTFNNNGAKWIDEPYDGKTHWLDSSFGAISCGGVLSLQDTTFNNNRAEKGGAINAQGNFSIQNCIFNSNYALGDGGAIYAECFYDTSTYEWVNVFNSAGSMEWVKRKVSGQLYLYKCTIKDSTFTGNSAGVNEQEVSFGGAIYSLGYEELDDNCVEVINSKFEANTIYDYLEDDGYSYNHVSGEVKTSGCIFLNAQPTSETQSASAKAKTTLTLKTVKVKKSAKKLVLKATLKQGNKALSGKKITFKFNGKKYSAKTNKKGIAKATIKSKVLKKLKVGKKVKYQASYGNIIVKKTVKVKK